MVISFLGPEGSHNHAAALKLFPGEKTLACPSITDALKACGAGGACGADLCVAPIENSVEGAVNETLDALIFSVSLYIVREADFPIEHNLITLKGADLDGIKTVYSHPQAAAQCRGYLTANFKGAQIVFTDSTSGGAAKILSPAEAAIAGAAAVKGRADLAIAKAGVQDAKNNATKFIVLSPASGGGAGDGLRDADCGTDSVNLGGGAARYVKKASVAFGAENKPGGLLSVLEVFKERGLNLTKIESRPNKKALGNYVFTVDFSFGGKRDELLKVLEALAARTSFLKFLGHWAAAR